MEAFWLKSLRRPHLRSGSAEPLPGHLFGRADRRPCRACITGLTAIATAYIQARATTRAARLKAAADDGAAD